MQSKLTTFLTSCPVHHSSFPQDVAYGTTTLKLESGESLEIPNMVRTSDNAGCYHCAFLLLSFPSLGQRVGVRIAGYDFSEAQAGKDTCDRRAAALKSHIRRYINESNDVKTSSDMKEAIDSHGGRQRLLLSDVQCDKRSQNMTKRSLSGIQSLNNFVFTESGEIIAWRAYNVGPGKVFLRRRWRVSVPLKAPRTYKFSGHSVLLTCWLASSVPTPPPQHTGTAACSTFDVAESCRRDSARRKSECGLWLPRGRVGKGLPKPQQPSATLGYRETPSGIRERVYVRRDQEKVDRDVQVSFC